MATIPTQRPAGPGGPSVARVVRVAGFDDHDPVAPWERQAHARDLRDLSTRHYERLPHRPLAPAEVPAGALDALRAVLGDLDLPQLFVIPRVVRVVGAGRSAWVVTPAQVLAVGAERLAVWLDDPAGARVRATIPIDDVVAVIDRTVLLAGRLELVARDESIVVHYNTVGRSDVRALLRHVRAAAEPVGPPPAPAGRDPALLPYKWRALVRSPDVVGADAGLHVVAAGDLAHRRPLLHNGVAVLTSRELLVATDPTPDLQTAQYGFDLVSVPRQRVLGIGRTASGLAVGADAWPGAIELHIAAHPSLVAEAVAVLGPLLGLADG